MKITIEPTQEQEAFEAKHKIVTVAVDDDDLNIYDFLEELLKPALLAVGFSKKLVRRITIDK